MLNELNGFCQREKYRFNYDQATCLIADLTVASEDRIDPWGYALWLNSTSISCNRAARKEVVESSTEMVHKITRFFSPVVDLTTYDSTGLHQMGFKPK